MDDPKHAQLRRTVAPEFLPGPMERFRPAVEGVVNERITHMLGLTPPIDLVAVFARYTPSAVAARLLGIPEQNLEWFLDLAPVLAEMQENPERAVAADAGIADYVSQLVDQRMEHPTDDLIGRLMGRRDELTHDELVNMVMTILLASHSTTSNTTALSVLSLLTDPELMWELRDNPDLVDNAVEELLRYYSVVQHGVRRVALADIPIGDTVIPEGEGVLIILPPANRDEDVFPNPDMINIHRDTRQHVAFGYGPHVCVGRPLARLTLQASLRAVISRIPTLRLAKPFEELRFQDDMFHHGVRELPVTW